MNEAGIRRLPDVFAVLPQYLTRGPARRPLRKSELATGRGEIPLDIGLDQYQSIDDTIVQLFIAQASVLMTRVDRIQLES
jgi:hypothetical protein